MPSRRMIERNREILAAREAGQSIELLAEQYCLTVARVTAVLVDERNRRMLSPEAFYREFRARLQEVLRVQGAVSVVAAQS